MTDKPSESFAAIFTSNKFPGGPVLVGRKRLVFSKFLQAIVINNKISNVCPGGGIADGGFADSQSICESVASSLQLPSSDMVFPSSTGIIGWRLPLEAMKNAIPNVIQNLQNASILPAAKGITTTDRYPKIRSISGTIQSTGEKWSIVAIAKGAGMIEPNLATMLCYILTDLNIKRPKLQRMLKDAVSNSFNCISVDGDQSTSDTVLAISSQVIQLPNSNGISENGDDDSVDEKAFASALQEICTQLAEDIVRNGEGTQHVIKVKVSGAPSKLIARGVGKSIVNSNLVKCAISGCDPNVGRIVGAVGSFLGNSQIVSGDMEAVARSMVVELGGIEIFSDGCFRLDPAKESALSDYMLDCQLYPADLPEESRNYPPHNRVVDISVRFSGSGSEESTVIGSDLTREYVDVNADYRS
eukprot:CAMPEP_0170073366 /NCGR_PEP_ID=MMETSP0019_2-20121128/10806_1 /TAXON_ID=98059 /ORGANISM="Dinobryon sp., Strain UTEXLB2267" /LENGTH=413 /DNA_ID=CAMNT_0010282869 /DNA_START=258 /DNA_END=1499 /DNA_ORIENTATION=+